MSDKRRRTHVSYPEDVWEALTAYSDAHHLTIGYIVIEALRAYLGEPAHSGGCLVCGCPDRDAFYHPQYLGGANHYPRTITVDDGLPSTESMCETLQNLAGRMGIKP